MKLSSTYFIAAALAAIAGSAIAAPSPLYAHALEQFNSFEPNLDVKSEVAELERNVDKESVDDLFTRAWYDRDHRDHRKTIRLLHKAARHNLKAIKKSHHAYQCQESSAAKETWRRTGQAHRNAHRAINGLIRDHREATRKRYRTPLHDDVDSDQQDARRIIAESERTIIQANHAIANPQ